MPSTRPNFLIIVADDLGFSDISPFGAEIATPALEALAQDGVRLTDFHTASACSPTRAMLMSGTDAHLAGLGIMAEYKQVKPKRWNDRPGCEGFLNKNVAALPELMQDNGYHTMLGGKWHLGARPDYNPKERGFDKSFSLLPGCCNHYMWEPQLENKSEYMNSRPIHTENGVRVDVQANKTNDPASGAYSSDLYTDKLLQYIDERPRDKPFFAYHAFSAPHWPLQAPRENIEPYKEMYLDGPYELRKRRLEAMKKLGIIADDVEPHDVVNNPYAKDWDELSDEQRALSSRAFAAYAGMVTRMDWNIQRVIAHLKDIGEYDNTFIIFMSDNGAEGAAYEAMPVMGAPNKVMKIIKDHYNNSLENIGNYDSFTWMGPLWAQAATAPSRLFKCHATQGGILVPAIVKFPQQTGGQGSISCAFSTCMDVAPTCLELAGIDHPAKGLTDGKAPHRGTMVLPMRGKSWVPYYVGGKPLNAITDGDDRYAVHADDEIVGWELFGEAALRVGRHKIVHEPVIWGGNARGDEGWQLYDLVADPGEIHDISEEMPELLESMIGHWHDYVRQTGTVWGAAADEPIPDDRDTSLLHDVLLDQVNAWMDVAPGHMPVIA